MLPQSKDAPTRPLLVLEPSKSSPDSLYADKASRSWHHSYWIIVPALVLQVVAYALVLPTLVPYLVQAYTPECKVGVDGCKGNYSAMQTRKTASDTARALLSVLSAPILGRASDSYGRKPVLILTLVLGLLPWIVIVVFDNVVPYFVVSALSGLNGSTNGLSFFPFQATVADWHAPEERAMAMSMIFAGVGVSAIVTPIVTLTLAKTRDYSDQVAFTTCLVFSVITLLYCVLAIPESLSQDKRAAFSPRLNSVKPPSGAAADAREQPRKTSCASRLCSLVFSRAMLRLLRRSDLLRAVAVVILLVSLPELGLVEIALTYTDDALGLDKDESLQYNSYLLIAVGCSILIASTVGMKTALKYLNEAQVTYLATVGNIVHFAFWVLLSIWPRPWVGYAAEAVAGFAFLAFPALAAILSNSLSHEEQGVGIGVLNAVKNLCGVIGPPFFGFTYAYFRKGGHFGGYDLASFPFIVSIFMQIFTMYWIYTRLIPCCTDERMRESRESRLTVSTDTETEIDASADIDDIAGSGGVRKSGISGSSI